MKPIRSLYRHPGLPWFAFLAFLSACTPPVGQIYATEAQAALPTVDLCLRDGTTSTSLTVERALTPKQHQRGLMGRETLAADAGMLFEYNQESNGTFWMYATQIPLDIAYLGREGAIRAIQGMEPCLDDNPANCPGYPAGVSYWSALEVNRGYFEREGIGIGARVTKTAPEHCTAGQN